MEILRIIAWHAAFWAFLRHLWSHFWALWTTFYTRSCLYLIVLIFVSWSWNAWTVRTSVYMGTLSATSGWNMGFDSVVLIGARWNLLWGWSWSLRGAYLIHIVAARWFLLTLIWICIAALTNLVSSNIARFALPHWRIGAGKSAILPMLILWALTIRNAFTHATDSLVGITWLTLAIRWILAHKSYSIWLRWLLSTHLLLILRQSIIAWREASTI